MDFNRLPSNNRTTSNRRVEQIATGRVGSSRGPKNNVAVHVQSIGNALFADVLVPAAKNMLVEFGQSFLQMLVFGDGHPQQQQRRGLPTSYNRMSQSRRVVGPERSRAFAAPSATFEDIYFEDRGHAEMVLGKMIELIATYGKATIGDLKSLVGITADYVDERWFYDNLSRTNVILMPGEGYVINFPKPLYS